VIWTADRKDCWHRADRVAEWRRFVRGSARWVRPEREKRVRVERIE